MSYPRLTYGAIATLSATVATLAATGLGPQAIAQTTYSIDALVELCEDAPSDDSFQCLLDQSSRLNRAKNLARQAGEKNNGGVTTIEAEPSMHGPSSQSPYSIETTDAETRYVFTFRLRPRATSDYTYETQVVVRYGYEDDQWTVDTVYNQPIEPTTVSYADTL